jgi:hypothetical protein
VGAGCSIWQPRPRRPRVIQIFRRLMVPRRLTLLLLLLALAACDTTPSDPLSERADLMAMAGVDMASGRPPAPLSLQGLLYSAVHRVYTEQGAGAARALVGDLRRLQEEARSAQSSRDREASTARLRAVQIEELDIVLRVFGEGVPDRVITTVAADGERLRSAVAASTQAGRDLPRGAALLAELDHTLAEAARAADLGDVRAALDAATRAAAKADGVRLILAEAKRIPALEDLFDAAVDALRQREGPDQTRLELERYNELQRRADASVGAGDRQRTHSALQAVRTEQVDIVLRVLGADATRRMLDAFSYSIEDVDRALAEARQGGRDIGKLERMAASARDLRNRASTALAAGDPETALDLGSHAVGLLNAIRLALTGH